MVTLDVKNPSSHGKERIRPLFLEMPQDSLRSDFVDTGLVSNALY